MFVESLIAATLVVSFAEPAFQRYDHRRVDRFVDESGELQPVRTTVDWTRRRADVLAGMQAAMGTFPDRSTLPPLDAKVVATKSFERFDRRTVSYVADGHGRVHADLYLPKGRAEDERRPAMLALHPTGALGKRIVAGEGPRANRQYAVELAERGYVVLAPDYPSFGDDAAYDFDADEYESGTMKGIVNHVRGVDLLCGLPDVDAKRIGVIGHSLGGHNAMFVAAFEPRLRVIVSSCGWTPFHDYYEGRIAGWTSPRYMPLLRTRYELDPDRVPFDFAEVVAALAPRPFFSNSPVEDGNFAVAGVRRAIPEAAKVYELFDARDALRVRYPPCGHDFPTETRLEAYRFIDAALEHEPTAEVDFGAELPRIPPLDPDEAQAAIAVAEGYRVELTAAEPLVIDPVAMSFDADGRLYVIEMRDYSEQDKAQLGRVRLLTDTDGDGRFDEATVFAEGLSWPTAITCWDGGVFVGAPPHLYFLKDTDGDGDADERRTVFTGFGRTNVQGMMNSLRWGLDGRIHGATSSSGARVTRPDDPDFGPVELRGRDFSFDPRTLDLRPESGGAQHGLCFDDWGRKFVCSNSNHLQAVLYEDRYAARNPYVKPPAARVGIAADGPQAPVFRRSPVEPWRIVRTRLRVAGSVRGPVEGGGKPAGYFTGATGVTIYRGDLMPELRGLAFIGDVGSNLVHRKRITPKGTTFVGERIDEQSEFLASTDIWFRPVQMANGPDGALHVLDMAREVIEHPKSLPPEIKRHLDLTSGRDRGRLWRVLSAGEFPRRDIRMSRATDVQLAAFIPHRNAWHRETAMRLLCERHDVDPKAVLRLRGTVADGSPEARVAALNTLAVLGRLEADDLLEPLSDDHDRLREVAVGHAERFARDPRVAATLSNMADDPDARVRFRVALAAAELPVARRATLLSALLRSSGEDPHIRFGCLSAVEAGGGEDVVAKLLEDDAFVGTETGGIVLGALAETLGRRAKPAEVAAVVAAVATAARGGEVVTERLLTGLRTSRSPLAEALTSGELGPAIERIVTRARTTAAGTGEAPTRIAAIRTLALGTPGDVELLLDLLDVRQPEPVQLAALATLGTRREPTIGAELVKRWPTLVPSIRREATETVLSRAAWRDALLDALAEGTIRPAEVDRARLSVLRATADGPLRERLDNLLRSIAGGRAKVVTRYRASVDLAGDAERGRAVFRKSCATCHRLEGHGHPIGPNLATLRNRGDEAVLLNVLDPNREVNPAFLNYVVVTGDGRQHVGILAEQSAASVTLKRPENRTETILRADIETIRSSGLSMMPEGIEKDVSVEAMADLLAYLRTVR